MNNELKYNPGLFSTSGFIGRYGYFFNLIHIWLISILFLSPYNIWVMKQVGNADEAYNTWKYMSSAPGFLKYWTIAGLLLVIWLEFINASKRITDIAGKEKTNLNVGYLVTVVISIIGNAFSPILSVFASFLELIIKLVLLFKKGEITSQEPYDYKKQFNWGAFLGTWIWGLYNKSFIPLLQLLLLLTPFNLYFALICGMKGNEWAFRNKKWDDVDKFNKSQKKQTLFWAIFSCILIPIIVIALFFGGIMFIANKATDDKQFAAKVSGSLENFITLSVKTNFNSYEITDDENKFYVKDEVWNNASFENKRKMLELAASVSANERNKKNKYGYRTKYKELQRTKIYSSSNSDKLLGEFVAPEKEPKAFKDYVNMALNAYRFYK